MKIGKSISKAILVMTVLTVSTSAFANDTVKKVLTVEEATKMAISNDSQLKTNKLNLEAYKEKLKNNNLEVYQYTDLDISTKQLEQTISFSADKISNEVWSLYNNYILTIQELAIMEGRIELSDKQLIQAKIKKERGLISQVDYDELLNKIEALKDEKRAKQQSISDMNKKFKMLVGVDITQYELQNNISYELFKYRDNIDGYIAGKVDDMLKYSEELANYYDQTRIDRASEKVGGLAPYWVDYLDVKAESSQKYTTITNNRQKYKESLLSVYSSLLSNEAKLEQAKANISVLEKQLKVAEIKFNAGLINTYDYESVKQDMAEKEFEIESLTYACEQGKHILEKPWLS